MFTKLRIKLLKMAIKENEMLADLYYGDFLEARDMNNEELLVRTWQKLMAKIEELAEQNYKLIALECRL